MSGIPGRKPNEKSVNRNPSRVQLREYVDVPFGGPWPVELPESRTIITREGQISVSLQPATRRWWEEVKRLPHAVEWDESTWGTYCDVATNIVDAENCGIATAIAQKRAWEKEIGKTAEQRRDMGIVYVTPSLEAVSDVAPVTEIASRSRRKLDDA